jgi:hypothetical protein
MKPYQQFLKMWSMPKPMPVMPVPIAALQPPPLPQVDVLAQMR